MTITTLDNNTRKTFKVGDRVYVPQFNNAEGYIYDHYEDTKHLYWVRMSEAPEGYYDDDPNGFNGHLMADVELTPIT